jgi:hypothetical protein
MRVNPLLVSAFLAAALCACSDSDPTDPSTPTSGVDLAGHWTFTARAASPPAVGTCTGDLAGLSFSSCGVFEADLVMEGPFFHPPNGSGSLPSYCNSIFNVFGTVASEVTGTISRVTIVSLAPLEVQVQSLEFTATVAGDTGLFQLTRLTIDGSTGECDLTGAYDAVRGP